MKAPHDFRAMTLVAMASVALGGAAAAQDGRPTPRPATPASQVVEEAVPEAAMLIDLEPIRVTAPGRRGGNGDKVVLVFDDVSVEDTIPFIVETTGKVVMPVNITTLKAKKVTLVNDRPIDRMEALDLLVQAFRLNDIGVIEYEDRIIIALLSEMPRYNPPVYGPGVDITQWRVQGTIITKIFAVENTDAANIAEQVGDPLPDHASIAVDPNSNQIIVTGDVALCQRIGKLIEELDRNYVQVKTQTFRLAHADANEIAQNILDLFEDTGTGAGVQRTGQPARSQQRMTPEQRRRARQAGQSTVTATSGPGPSAELRITVNVQQNSVTVSGEPTVVDDIGDLIADEWDQPRPEATKKVYHLQYTDPIKMRDMLTELLGGATGGIGGAARRGARAGQAAGGAGRSDVAEAIGGIYQIQAYPDSNSLVVICKTKESFQFLDSLIAELDQPVYPGIPIVVELKHADAEEVADQVNAIFAPAGARVDLQRRERGLAGVDIGGGVADTGGGAAGPAREGGEGGSITFPWQQGRQGADEQTPESPLIGKIRVVPIHRQNAVMILAAPEYREAVRDIVINQLDKPGRQVLIAAIIAEVELSDELALGLRLSNSDAILGGVPIDNRLGASGSFSGTISDIFGGLFDAPGGTFDVGPNAVNVVLQALAQKTKIRILQEPAVFTADNQEASFFEGQDVPVLVNTQLTPEGTLNNTTEYQAVGIGLNVRPRITTYGDVDMEINLEISNIDIAASAVSGADSPTFDRRETTTEIIVKDGQTIVISGILRDQESKVKRKVPLLGDIPILGALFTSVEDQNTRTELLAFITPFVVENPEENNANFNQEARQRLMDLSKPLKDQDVQPIDRDEVESRLLMERYKKYFDRERIGE